MQHLETLLRITGGNGQSLGLSFEHPAAIVEPFCLPYPWCVSMSLSQTYPAAAPAPESSVQRLFVIGVGVLIAALAVHVANLMDVRRAYTFLIGGLLGFVLYRAAFGFTAPWRQFIAHGRGASLRATLVMLGTAAVAMILLGSLGGYANVTHGVGPSLLIGAFMFGLGMQLAGCCGSGTAYVAGGGSARIMIALVFFIVGSVWGSIDVPAWWGLPIYARFSLVEAGGPWLAIAASLAALAALGALTYWWERRRHGEVEGVFPSAKKDENSAVAPIWCTVLFGRWGAVSGAVVLGLLTGAVLVVSLQPWGITFGFTLYGAKIATALGIDLAAFQAPFTETSFWGQGWAQGALSQPIWANNAATTTVGLFLGAALAAGLSGKWKPSLKGVGVLSILAAILGGLLMGYGARISTGCNIGAMVVGIASGSLHGWAWMGLAFLGSIAGVFARPLFRLVN